MDNFLKKQFYVWVYTKLKEEPNKFGVDGCNALFMQKYLEEHYNVYLPIGALRAISTVSRVKSEVLLQNPQWDNRVKDAPKSKKRD